MTTSWFTLALFFVSRIALLPEEVASQVAAGEVVERPASVIKELVENSLDAKASRIEVLIRRGGISYLRVSDNGMGMDRDDALLCLERHATSKIRTGLDLSAIVTLGFRGEALPSIASVSKFRLATREAEALAGTEVLVAAGRLESVRDCGEAPGTQIEVRSLFYNLPARRKFLRTENTEASHVEHQLQLLAFGHPEVGFTFINEERLVFQLPPTTSLRERIRDLRGPGAADELLEMVPFEQEGLSIRGFIGKAGVSRSSRQQQLVFLNGRAVENSAISFGLREGYHTALVKGQHPVSFIFIQMDPAAVDVNVHPAKREVRFRDAGTIREALIEVVRRTLESDRAVFSQTFHAAKPPLPVPETLDLPVRPAPVVPPTQVSPKFVDRTPTPAPVPSSELLEANFPVEPTQEFKILGVLGKTYLLMESSSGLVLVDQRAAHERILFEEMRRRMDEQGVPAQRLLIPLTIQVPPRDADWLLRNLPLLEKAGIGLELFGSATFKIDSLPTFVRTADPAQLVREIIDELRESSAQGAKLRLGEEMIAKTVCRHAVKGSDVLREPERVRLIRDLLACELPYCCPLGRPTMIQFSYSDLEKKFGRRS